jgi:uncharacterized protein YbjQ (UPF0145 family)
MFGNKTKLTCAVCDKSIDDLELSAVTKTGERIHDWCISAVSDEDWQAKKDAQDKLLNEMHITTAASLVDRNTLSDRGYVQAQYAVALEIFAGFPNAQASAGQEFPQHETLLHDAINQCMARLAQTGAKKGGNALLNTQITPTYVTNRTDYAVLVIYGAATAALVSEASSLTTQAESVQ